MRATAVGERIQLLDIARGFAVLGILFVNMMFYSTSLQAIQWRIQMWPAWWDKAVQTAIEIFISGKFLAVFSFLFGYGMIVFKGRAEQKGRRFVPLYARRLFLLMVFGLLHGWFIWFGDILFHYALLGFVLLLFHNRKPRTLLVWAVVLLSLLPLLVLLGGADTAVPLDPEFEAWIQQSIVRDDTVYSSGSYREIQSQRLSDWSASAFNQVVFYPQILGLFLLGAYFARRTLFHDAPTNRRAVVRLALWTGGPGLLIAVLPVVLQAAGNTVPDVSERLSALSAAVGGPLLGLFYVATLALLLDQRRWQATFGPIAAVGRMAFTNYIGQSIMCTFIFYGYGLGMYGRTGPLANALLAIGVFALQLWLSAAWLKRYRMGPLEWVWRAATYGSVSPLRKAKARMPKTDDETVSGGR